MIWNSYPVPVSPAISVSSGLRALKAMWKDGEWPFPCITYISGIVRSLHAETSLLRYNLAVIKICAVL